jgi:succinate dehydrogenase/fumarate reductase flavoprotein subunit
VAEQFDVIVVGSGAAGLTTAIVAAQAGLSVLVVEKAALFGGTTALSFGGAWIPNNHHMPAAGQSDTPADAYAYLRAVLGDWYDEAFARAYVETAPGMLRYMEERTELRFGPGGLPDYRLGAPGAKASRIVATLPWDGRALGKLIRHVRDPLPGFRLFGSFQVDPTELPHLTAPFGSGEALVHTVKRMAGFVRDIFVHGKGTWLANGGALVGRLLKSAVDAGVSLRHSSPAIRLVTSEGVVTGVVVEHGGVEQEILAQCGVVLASGGWGANEALRARYMPLPAAHLSTQPAECVGDGIAMGQGAGGELVEENEANGIWAPCSARYDRLGRIVSVFPHFGDRGKPGEIIVGTDGRRFINEACSYQDFGNAMNARGIESAWLIADRTALRQYGIGLALPALPFRHLVRAGYLIEARTLAQLADRIGLPAGRLERTVAEFNANALHGKDPEFGRGTNIYNHMQGDPAHKPNPNLGPLDDPPFYAVRLQPGDCSSILGLRTSIDAEVLRADGSAVPGLYAVGLDANSMMRGTYPGGGASIGPGMVFGYRAAKHLSSPP